MTTTVIDQPSMPTTGALNAALANAVVKLTREYTGRGPTEARAALVGDVVTVVLRDTLTTADRTLVLSGRTDLVKEIRREFQSAMRRDLVTAVERLTFRRVVAFMSDQHIDPDVAIEVFVLAPESQSAQPTPAASERPPSGDR
jgi:uncharacterized protein YbcI